MGDMAKAELVWAIGVLVGLFVTAAGLLTSNIIARARALKVSTAVCSEGGAPPNGHRRDLDEIEGTPEGSTPRHSTKALAV